MKKLLLSLVLLVGCYDAGIITGIDWGEDYTEEQLIRYELSVDDSVDSVIVEVVIVKRQESTYYYSVEENSKLYEIYIDVNLASKQEITITIDGLTRYKGTRLNQLTDIYVDNVTVTEL